MKSLILILLLLVFSQVNSKPGDWGWDPRGWVGGNSNETGTAIENTETTSPSTVITPVVSFPSSTEKSVQKSTRSVGTKESTTENLTKTTISSTSTIIVQRNQIPSVAEYDQPIEQSLDEKGCPINLFPELETYFNNSKLSDLDIIINDHTIKSHQFILNAKSSVMAAIIDNLYTGVIKINSEDTLSFIEFLRFFYTESFIITEGVNLELIKNVYFLAKKYRVERLLTTIKENLNKTFTLEKLSPIFEFAYYEQDLNETVGYWRKYVHDHSQEIFNRSLYFHSNYLVMESIIASMNMSESQKMDAINNIREQNRTDINMNRIKRVVNINVELCNGKELARMRDMKLIEIDGKFWDQLIKKFDKSCQTEERLRVIEKRYHDLHNDMLNLNKDNQDLVQKCDKQKIINYVPKYLPSPNHYSVAINPDIYSYKINNNQEHISSNQINIGLLKPLNKT